MTFLEYVYSIKKNYILLHVYAWNGDSAELQQTMFVPFAPTRINAIDGTIEKQNQLTGFSIMSNGFNLCNIMMMTINGDEYAKNRFVFVDDSGKYDRSFDEICNDFMQYTGFTDSPSKPNLVQWGEIVGGVQNQSDLNSILNQKNTKQIALFVDPRQKYETWIQYWNPDIRQWENKLLVECYNLGIDFGTFSFNPNFKYTILIDRYRSKRYKGTKYLYNEFGEMIGRSRKYAKSQFVHESQIDCQNNNRINEIGIDIEKLQSMNNKWNFSFMQQQYFNAAHFPIASGTNVRKKHLAMRLRIENETSFVETDPIAFFDLIGTRSKGMEKEQNVVSFKIK